MTAEQRPWLGWLIIAGVLAVPIWLLHQASGDWRATGAIVGVLVLMGWRVLAVAAQQRAELAASRANESICEFARSFPRASLDPVLVRAVYETVQAQMGTPAVPIRCTDRFAEDLDLDGDDLDEVYLEVAELTQRSTADGEKNPFSGKVQRVADLVSFLEHQPPLLPSPAVRSQG
ncbi:hypothetical protein [Prosthecobacter sp.]|uniref:hypothetical protein n=1 Tax=Prosthecobacter sp. TaxID=1965333 RepID=UPI002ABCF558|nr:hypothetical protein [Prosthecobacter sp.]MDZ4402345.1 hypothetical protein [Prosthecobacter sp.]